NAIVDKAREDAIAEGQKQKAAAEAEIANLSHKAREVLRQQVASLAVAGASKILQREIDANRHRELLDQLAREI
ncbi:MAG TPA: F0F1 ATP synthase subunit B, partial [Xanthomonadales bacterium]|nr:F0F1 ATP synthase subunit B [Xanthomonadales bacterium]